MNLINTNIDTNILTTKSIEEIIDLMQQGYKIDTTENIDNQNSIITMADGNGNLSSFLVSILAITIAIILANKWITKYQKY